MSGRPDDKKLEFTGKGFSEEKLSAEENAQFRELVHHYVHNFQSVDDFLIKTGLKWLSSVAKGFPAFLGAFLATGSIASAIVALRLLGIW